MDGNESKKQSQFHWQSKAKGIKTIAQIKHTIRTLAKSKNALKRFHYFPKVLIEYQLDKLPFVTPINNGRKIFHQLFKYILAILKIC